VLSLKNIKKNRYMANKHYFHEIQWRKSKGQFQFRIIAGNGESVLPSERYTRKSTMFGMIKQAKEDIKHDIPVTERNANWSKKKTVNGDI
jgi:uncharacterized protein YegP (UPF0339 family)